MRIVYMGTPQFAVSPLRALAAAGHEIVGVVTRTDKPAGRGRSLTTPPVKSAAVEIGLSVYQPKRVRETAFIDQLRAIGPEVVIVAAYGQILPREILTLPKFGCINIHASLLPSYRGAAPINWAIIKGEEVTGITIMQMDEGMDTGAILLQEKIAIDPADTAGSLTERLSTVGAKLITTALPLIADGRLVPLPQEGSRATSAPLLKKEDGLIDWNIPAVDIYNRIRGLSPWPGAYTFLDGKTIKIIAAEAVSGTGEPGLLYEKEKQVLETGTGKGLLRIVSLQPEGKRPMSAGDFLRGHRGLVGKKFSVSRYNIFNSEQ
ncbi:MAG TPA: methionyl-tRNA formyltransferase [Nitrospirota bacterium]|nr:methionyl-tRNA formyltransferase [Nitrospirota bacterium]